MGETKNETTLKRVIIDLSSDEQIEAFIRFRRSLTEKMGVELTKTQVLMWLINNADLE